MIDIFEKFHEQINDVKGFDWKPEWSVLNGIETPIDYARELTNVNSLERFSIEKHKNKNFTGFIAANKGMIEINDSLEMVEFAYLERGVFRYFQCHEGYEEIYSKKFKFYDDNFCLHKGYSSNSGGKLTYVFRMSDFKIDDLAVGFSRTSPDSASVYVSRNFKDSFFVAEIPRVRADILTLDNFKDYGVFVDSFRDLEAQAFGNVDWFNKKYDFLEALEMIK